MLQITLRIHPMVSDMIPGLERMLPLLSAFSDDTFALGQPRTVEPRYSLAEILFD